MELTFSCETKLDVISTIHGETASAAATPPPGAPGIAAIAAAVAASASWSVGTTTENGSCCFVSFVY